MAEFTQQDKIEISKILASIEGRLDKRLVKLTMDLILKTSWTKSVAINLYKNNVDNIPDKSLNAFLLGSHFGQIYQISLDFAKKLELSLSPNQKNILREFAATSFTPYRKVNKLQSIPLILQQFTKICDTV